MDNAVLTYIVARLKEPSTWAGLSAVFGTAATQLDPTWGLTPTFLIISGVSGALAFGLKEQSATVSK